MKYLKLPSINLNVFQVINSYVPNVRIISSTLAVYMVTIQHICDTRTLQENRFTSM